MKDPEVNYDYYVYMHCDKDSGKPFYVGKGRDNRAYQESNRPKEWHDYVNSLQNGFEVKIVEWGLEEDDASAVEQNLIQRWGKQSENSGSLINKSDGGDVDKGGVVGLFIPFPEGERELGFDFKMLRGEERTKFANDLIRTMETLDKELEPCLEQDDFSEFIDDLHCEFSSLKHCAVKYLKRQMDSETMALNLKGSYDGSIVDLDDYIRENDPDKIIKIVHKAQATIKQFYDRMGIEKES